MCSCCVCLPRVLGPSCLTHGSLVLAQLALREELYEIRGTHPPPPSPGKEPETSPRRAKEECLANWERTQAIEREMGEGKGEREASIKIQGLFI